MGYGVRAVGCDEPRAERIRRVSPHARVRAANGIERAPCTGRREVRRAVAAQQRERTPRAEIVPERFEFLRCEKVAFLRKQVHHFTVRVEPGWRCFDEALDDCFDNLAEESPIGTAVPHEPGHRGCGVQERDTAMVDRLANVDALLYQVRRNGIPIPGPGNEEYLGVLTERFGYKT